jgi:hypothetical protein
MKNINTRVRLNYTATDADSNDTLLDLDVSFDNADFQTLMDNINTWLTATGHDLVVRPKHEVMPIAKREVAPPREDLYKKSMMERTN